MKRLFDFSLSLFGFFFFLPLWVILIFVIWLEDKGPVFYLQDRVGCGGKIFQNIKFRSMVKNAEDGLGPVQAKKDDPRETKIGRLMRKTAMDELPQLINIIKGEMSFVGPRSLRPLEVSLEDSSKLIDISKVPGFAKRSSIRPGLTGAAQVYVSRSIDLEEKFKHDAWYVDNSSLWLDIKLIFRSIVVTLRAKWDT